MSSLLGTQSPAAVPPVGAEDENVNDVNVIPVTSLVVGEVMSKDDVYYTPHTDNPFAAKFKDATMKLVSASVDFQWLKFDLPSPSHPHTPPATPASPEHLQWTRPLDSWFKSCHSMPPGSPYASQIQASELQWLSETCRAVPSSPSGNLPASLFKQPNCENLPEDSGDALSDTSSAADSALGFEILKKDIDIPWHAPNWIVRQKQYNVSLGRFLSRSELMGRYVESRQAIQRILGMHNDLAVTSFSSSESCLSVDESALLSPTSSYSSDSDFWHRGQHWRTYEKLQSREKVQGLVKMWETIQARRTDARFSVTQRVIDETECEGEVSAGKPIAAQGRGRLEFFTPNLERKFQELKQQWMKHQKIHASRSSIGDLVSSSLNESTESKD